MVSAQCLQKVWAVLKKKLPKVIIYCRFRVRAKLAIEKPVPSYMRATATTARKNDLVELRRLKQQATSQDTLDRLKNLREKLRKNK